MSKGRPFLLLLLAFGASEARAATEAAPGAGYIWPNSWPTGAHGDASPFDWQEAWGTIHMNSDADGLLDPGHASTDGNARMPCRPGSDVCDKARVVDLSSSLNYVDKIDSVRVGNGIKYDIKNSVLNCMSKVVPNSPIFNGGDAASYAYGQCTAAHVKRRDGDRNKLSTTDHPYSLIYLPLWVKNGTDGNDSGCHRQVINNCVQDVHDCGIGDDGLSNGTAFPTTHVFTKSEVQDLCGAGKTGCQLPSEYWRRKENGIWRLSAVDPNVQVAAAAPSPQSSANAMNSSLTVSSGSLDSANPSPTPSTTPTQAAVVWEHVDNKKDPALDRIKAYKVDLASTADVKFFYIVDPSDFFDMRLYIGSTSPADPSDPNGRYPNNYSEIINGVPVAQDTCPILGASGYNGICDPTGEAGCNLPVYGVKDSTTFTDKFGNVTNTVAYPLKWSGYVKDWKIISKEQYLVNTKNRKNLHGGNLYADAYSINNNPILMVYRANSFCDTRERYSGWVKQDSAPDMPCIQYKQYQRMKDDKGADFYTFADLFQPDADIGINNTHSISRLTMKDGRDPVIKFVPGALPPSEQNPAKSADFLDTYMPWLKGRKPAIERSDYASKPVYDYESKEAKIGEQLLKNGAPAGFGYKLEAGTKLGLRYFYDSNPEKMKNRFNPNGYENGSLADKAVLSTRCAIVDRNWDRSAKGDNPKLDNLALFVPTKSQEELDSFIHASADSKVANANRTVDRAVASSCDAQFQTYDQANGYLNSTSQARLPEPPKFTSINPITKKSVEKQTTNPNKTLTWIGTTSCSQLTTQPTCNESKIISAQRYCMLSDGVQGSCGDCKGVVDPDEDVDFSLKAVAGPHAAEIMTPMGDPNTCFFKAACFAVASAGCPTTKTGGHIFCLSADTKISMADGSQKEIAKIQAGEMVLSFGDEDFRQRPFAATVHSVAVTNNQTILNVSLGKNPNDVLKITAEHKVVLSSGRAIEARDLLEGDEVVRTNGKSARVRKIEYSDEQITVYNLVLEEGAEGYMANGFRVLSYPLSAEMSDASRSQRTDQ